MKLTVVAVEQIGSRTNVPFCNDADLAAIVLYASVCVCVCVLFAHRTVDSMRLALTIESHDRLTLFIAKKLA